MECIALLRCGSCLLKTRIWFKALSINRCVTTRLLVEEAARRCDKFVCGDSESTSPYLVSIGQIDIEPTARAGE